MDQKKLVSNKLVSTTSLNDNSVVAKAILASKSSFWYGSYAEGYGNSVTGGVHIYLSPRDAPLVTTGAAGAAGFIGGAIAGIFTKNQNIANAAGVIVAFAVEVVYWDEQNSNGSLDIWIPYANLLTVLVPPGILEIKIGDNWYVF